MTPPGLLEVQPQIRAELGGRFDADAALAVDEAVDHGLAHAITDWHTIPGTHYRRIGTTYDSMGRVETVTRYSDTSGTTAVNQVKEVYNTWGNVSREYQEHSGTVDANSLYVDYDYADGASGGVAKYVRLDQVTYPNGRQVQYDYGTTGAIDDIMSRLATIGDGTNTQATYTYLGRGTVVAEDYVEAGVKLDYAHDNLAGFDRFGRVVDQLWTDYGANPDVVLDRYTYEYDRVGNRTSKTNALHSAFSETYDYDDLARLTTTTRNDSFDQSWTLDGLGNWSGFNDDGASQTREVNGANEITSTAGIATPTYDRAGNMTVIPSPTDADSSHTESAKYDAWNHLVEVTDGGVLVAKFSYDGTGRRSEQLTNVGGNGVPQNATHYYLSGQQVIETREGSPTANPESLSPKYQNVWSPRYVDSLILRDTYSGGVLQTASRLFYLADANYNVTAVVGKVDEAWQALERYVYSAYGKATIYTPDWTTVRSTSVAGNTTLYTGRELDLATNLYYYRARYYSAYLGSFVNRDPIESDLNLYRYCCSSPVNTTDPSGLVTTAGQQDSDCCSEKKKGKTCGPEVGSQLILTILALNSYFSKLDYAAINRASKEASIGIGIQGWDITGLTDLDSSGPGWESRKGTECETCVTVFGAKQDLWEVNYMLWGYLNQKLHLGVAQKYGFPWFYKNYIKNEENPLRPKDQYTTTLVEWIDVGYMFAGNGAFMKYLFKNSVPKNDNPRFEECGRCGGSLPLKPFPVKLVGSL